MKNFLVGKISITGTRETLEDSKKEPILNTNLSRGLHYNYFPFATQYLRLV
jgi:hypothetical protein